MNWISILVWVWCFLQRWDIFTAEVSPAMTPAAPELQIQWNPIPQFKELWGISREKIAVWNSMLGISWFWFFGAGILSVLPVYCKSYLGVDSNVATVFFSHVHIRNWRGIYVG